MTTKVLRSSLLLLAGACLLSRLAGASPEHGVIEVPFEFHQQAIVARAKIDGQGPFNVMIDTGVDPSVVDLQVARALKLKIATVGHQGSGGGSEENLAYETSLPLVQLGGLRAKGIAALAVDLAQAGEALGKPIHAILGYSLLKDRIVQIDYPQRIARFYSTPPRHGVGTQPDGSAFTTLPFRYSNEILIDKVLVNGKALVANLDTGSNSTFQLTPAAVAELGLEAQLQGAQTSSSVGFNGRAENRRGRLDTVTLGDISVSSPEAVFYGKMTGHDQEAWSIRIGNAFLQDFVVTIDYQRQLITLERR